MLRRQLGLCTCGGSNAIGPVVKGDYESVADCRRFVADPLRRLWRLARLQFQSISCEGVTVARRGTRVVESVLEYGQMRHAGLVQVAQKFFLPQRLGLLLFAPPPPLLNLLPQVMDALAQSVVRHPRLHGGLGLGQ